MGFVGMCRCEGYGFHAVNSGKGYINQRFWSRIGYHFPGYHLQLVEDLV